MYVAVILALLSTAHSPRAVTKLPRGQCVWQFLRTDTKRAALKAGIAGGPLALLANIDSHEMSVAEKRCGITPENHALFQRAESGFLLQALSEEALADQFSISAARLQQGWKSLDRQSLTTLSKWAIYLNVDKHEWKLLADKFAGSFSMTQDMQARAEPMLIAYLQGRALQAVYEREL